MAYFGIFAICLVVCAIYSAITHKLDPRVFIAGGVSALIGFAVYGIGGNISMTDWQVINGSVASKPILEEECKYPGWYDYSDDFCTNEDTRRVIDYYEEVCKDITKCNNNKCVVVGQKCEDVPVYKTQYRYEFPWERKYRIETTIGTYRVERIDRQGAQIPPRHAEVVIGDPVSTTSSYTNYLMAAQLSIINPVNAVADQSLLAIVPPYPMHVYDMYKVDRFVPIGLVADNAAWNKRIAEINSRIGPAKQANLIVVATTTLDRDIRQAIYKKWSGGKKNDVIWIVSVNKENKIEWSDGITFLNNTGNEFMVNELSQLAYRDFHIDLLNEVENIVLKRFDRRAMKSIEYIKDNYSPPPKVFISSFIVAVICLIGAIFFMRYFDKQGY